MFASSAQFRKRWSALFGLWALQGAAAFGWFWASRSFSLDLSLGESLSAGFLLFWVFLNLFSIVFLFRKSSWLERLSSLAGDPTVRDGIFASSIFAFFLLLGGFVLQSIADKATFRVVGYLKLLSPLLTLAAATLAEVAALILFFAFRRNFENKESLKTFIAKFLFALASLGLTALYIARSGMGIEPLHQGDWAVGIPAAPFLEWEILLAVFVCAAAVLAETRLPRLSHPDFWIALSVWVFASVLWLSQPVVPNSSALEPLAPNFEIYPFNDAQTYDEFAQSVLIGGGFRGDAIPQRPLYILFLVVLHLFAGQDYASMIALQSLVFAFFPVLLYFLGKEFWGRPLGLSLALLAILRDYTSNLVSPFTGNLSYSKVYLSEIPTAMALALFLLFGVRWIKAGFPLFRGFVLGGILGIAMLIRTQTVTALPALLLFAFVYRWNGGAGLSRLAKTALLALSALLLVVSPWLWRNWRAAGAPIFDSPESQTINLALRYSRLNGVEPQALPLPGESSREYNERLQRIAREAIESNPAGALRGVISSFLNHGINNLLLFPLRNDLRTFAELWIPTHAFWEEWEGKPTPPQAALLFFYLLLLGLGIAALWQRNGFLGLLPLGLNLAYNLWTSLALLSGQRFMLAMDWSIALYYAAGLFALLSAFLFALERGRALIVEWHRNNPVSSVAESAAPVRWFRFFPAAVLFLGIGVSLPLAERAFPPRYPEISQSELARVLLKSPAFRNFEFFACVKQTLEEGRASLLRGRALYPRYYEAGGGEPFTDSFGYKKSDEGRLVFTLMGGGEISPRIVFPMQEPPSFFPHASDVTLLYGADGGLWLALVETEQTAKLYVSSRFASALCGK